MATIGDVCKYLRGIAPLDLAEDWDNVGLLVGSPDNPATTLMTCLTVTPSTVEEAVSQNVNLIVTHHPFPFRSLKKITTNDMVGRMLLRLIENNVAVYSAHTAFDSAKTGINRQLAESLELKNIQPLCDPSESDPTVGTGRFGVLSGPTSLDGVASTIKAFLKIENVRVVGAPNATVQRTAIACGSAGQFIEQARQNDCQLLITGETSFHTCLEAEATDIGLILLGHYASERFAMDSLAQQISAEHSDLTVWASKSERDPLRLV